MTTEEFQRAVIGMKSRLYLQRRIHRAPVPPRSRWISSALDTPDRSATLRQRSTWSPCRRSMSTWKAESWTRDHPPRPPPYLSRRCRGLSAVPRFVPWAPHPLFTCSEWRGQPVGHALSCIPLARALLPPHRYGDESLSAHRRVAIANELLLTTASCWIQLRLAGYGSTPSRMGKSWPYGCVK